MPLWSTNSKRYGQRSEQLEEFGAPGRTRTGTPPFGIAADFKSAVSTGFTTGAGYARSGNAQRDVEAGVGIEPAYTALQAAA